SHPNNLVAVKKTGTPVVESPSLNAKPLFLANMHDEFELLDYNADWVHVRISGIARGWIWRNSLEMPEGVPDMDPAAASTLKTAQDLFHIEREETTQFPGDWAPLRGKNVKIFSVQKVDDSVKDNSTDRLEYTKFLFEKNYAALAGKPQEFAGIVVIFDSIDGGLIAATLPSLQEWRAGTLSDSALWHKCYFDPPETFDPAAGSSASQ
ncbi:MAG: SH3 domain-containing protein, partial [Candidatus Sulfotelmatobacter sp.]